MKKLAFLISTENKTTEQIAAAAKEAWAKYQKVSKEVGEKVKTADKEEDLRASNPNL
ncbi:MAG: hypothetical protein NTY75_00215 [Candidatus Shapirobacteria bacterium]|nr:hypothetical protein [Candidatus Shapirobacteria bacterium]